MSPRVTVIIPTFNWSSVLPYSIGSVLGQTYTDFELLVIGDGCTDDSQQVVSRIVDPRLRWINLPENTGHQTAPNNHGLSQARGQIIAYLGHDDLWLPHHLLLAISAIDAGADLTYPIVAMIPPNSTHTTFEPCEMEHYERGLWIPPTGVVHRKTLSEKVGGWRKFIDVNQDPESDLWSRMNEANAKFHYIRRLTAVKFPAIWRKDVYKLKRCHEQAAWFERIKNEPDFEANELAKMLIPTFPDKTSLEPFSHILSEFGDQIKTRFKRRLRSWGLQKPVDRKRFLGDRRKFKGLDR